MKKINFFILLFTAILLTGCTSKNKTHTQDIYVSMIGYDQIEAILTKYNTLNQISTEINIDPLRIEDNMLLGSDLCVTIPQNWVLYEEVHSPDSSTFLLIDTRSMDSSFYEHQIEVRQYQLTKWDNKRLLIQELMELTGKNHAVTLFNDGYGNMDTSFQLIQLTGDYEYCWAFVKDSLLYVFKESEYYSWNQGINGFVDFLNKEYIGFPLGNTLSLDYLENRDCTYYSTYIRHDKKIFVEQKWNDDSWVNLFDWDNIRSPFQSINAMNIHYKDSFKADINFDGYIDMEKSNGVWALYNPETHQFEDVETYDVFYFAFDCQFLEESELIRFNRYIWIENKYVETEEVWRWEGDQLVEVEMWESDTFEYHIPQDFLDMLSKNMLYETKDDYFESVSIDYELDDEEIKEIMKDSKDIWNAVIKASAYSVGSFAMHKADGDNDGIDDILLEHYQGGSGLFTDCSFFKGQEDGSYYLTSQYPHVMEEVQFISYDDTNYLVRFTYDYSKKTYSKIAIYYYEDGIRTEEAWLYSAASSYESEVTLFENKYKQLIQKIQSNGEKIYSDLANDIYVKGESEHTEEIDENGHKATYYFSDYNNNGTKEKYQKNISSTRNRFTDSLDLINIPESIWDCVLHGEEYEYGNAMMLWVEPSREENIICILYENGLWDFYICGYLMNGEEWKQVFIVEFMPNITIEQERNILYY